MDVQTDLSLPWAHMSFCWIGRKAAHIYTEIKTSHAVKEMVLNSISSQCALGKSSDARKSEVDPKTFKKCNASDFKF